jgi:hypothetical protein
MKRELIGYAIRNKENKKFLDHIDYEVDGLELAKIYYFEDCAMESQKEIDVAYLYEVVKVKVNYEVIESEDE